MMGLNRDTGATLDNEADHVRQSVADILTTPIGSRVMRRDYGSVIPELIDQPLNNKTILRLYAASAAALMRWEPRIKLASISFSVPAEASAIIEISGTVGDRSLTTSVQLRG